MNLAEPDRHAVGGETLVRTLVIDNWRRLEGFGFKGFSVQRSKLDKGHAAQFEALARWIRSGGPAPVPLESSVNSTAAALAAVESLAAGRWVDAG